MSRVCKNEQMNCLEEECLNYIREQRILRKILEKFIHKYDSYGKVAGRIALGKLAIEEIEVLEGFFQKNYHGKQRITISSNDLERALKNSRYASVSKERLLELYATKELKSKAQVQEEIKNRWEKAIEEIGESYKGSEAIQWLLDMNREKKYAYVQLQAVYKANLKKVEELKNLLILGCEIVNQFPKRRGEQEYLAIFATKLTSNPHAFDEGESLGSFLYQLVLWEGKKDNYSQDTEIVFASQQKQRLYLNAGILRDDISNYAVLSGVQARKIDGTMHQGMDGFFREKDTAQVSLAVLATWKEIICQNNELYIVENPSIYATLLKGWNGDKSLMCMNGQPKLSSLLVLDLLDMNDVTIYYAGDFDPEGLHIAQKVKQYYKGKFYYWHMGLEDYKQCQSHKKISAKSLKSLQGIVDEELQEVVREMQACEKAGYQEQLSVWY